MPKHTFSVPVWFNVDAESKEEAVKSVEACVKPFFSGPNRLNEKIEYSVESSDVIEFDENGDEVDAPINVEHESIFEHVPQKG